MTHLKQQTETIPEEPEEEVAPQGIQIEGVDIHGQFLQHVLQHPVIVTPPLVDNQPNVQVVNNQDVPPAAAEGGLHDHPVVGPQIVEVVNIPPIEDMSDTVIAPPPFSGKPTEDPGDWLRAFSNYCTFKGYNDAQKRNLFRVLLTGPAADWLDNRTFPDAATFDNYKTDFEARYKTPEVMKYKSARHIFTRRQEDGETTDDYSTSMIKLGKVIRRDVKVCHFEWLKTRHRDICHST